MRELRVGEDVLARDGSRLGTLERLVVDADAHRITHIVVHGRLLGLGRLRDAGPDGLASDLTSEELQRLPEAHDELVGPPAENWTAPAGYRLDSFLRLANAVIGQVPYVPPVRGDLDVSSFHEITPSSPVWSGRERLGEVAEVQTDEEGRLIDLVLDRGFLLHRVRIPAGRVVEVVGNNVHVDLTDEELHDLPREDLQS
ncbi:MAG: PRC-barrel domain-containing protein [Candidatus Dormibacteraeota bacterium]|nr:PRC-barrel domain-containing protein [Candidatus Dormibacteraeota bacterium]